MPLSGQSLTVRPIYRLSVGKLSVLTLYSEPLPLKIIVLLPLINGFHVLTQQLAGTQL